MKGKGILVSILVLLPVSGQALDFALQYYAPALLGIVSGEVPLLALFEDHESDSHFLIPLETKVLALRFDAFALSGNAIVSLYLEDGSFSSLNVSVGASLYLNRRRSSPMKGWYLSLYPLYELPLFTGGKQPWLDWRAALDLGLSVDFGLICLGAFSRYVAAWRGSDVLPLADWGITAGFHYR
ncbi:MAG: hypothetical protein LBU16_03050 [Treponema sp.]|jgi:hypothetical protein|nr:hypothetical protein [Treponema sp.]